MKPAIITSFDKTMSLTEVIPMIRQAGFEAISFGAYLQQPDYTTIEGRASIRKLLADNELVLDSMHAPFPRGDQLFSLEEDERLESISQCQIALDTAVELDGRIVVVHLIQPYGIPEGEVRDRMVEKGKESIGALAAYAQERGAQLALENGQRAEYDMVLRNLLAQFDDAHIGLCYDAGHENVQGAGLALLEELGERLLTVHIHDNNGSDTHELPFEGTIDWERFMGLLQKTDYSGNLLLEVDINSSAINDPAEFLAETRNRVEQLYKYM